MEPHLKIRDIEFVFRASHPGEEPDEYLPEIAFIGRSNVGKSSLLNSLIGRKKLAKTSGTPGKTRAIDWYRLEADAGACFFVDLPGYGYAKVSKKLREEHWARLIDTYLGSERPLMLALQLLDIRRDGPTDLDQQMIDWLRETEVPHAFVLTKADKLKRGRRVAAAKSFASMLSGDIPPIPYSAVTGEGKRELWSLIDQRLAQASRPSTTPSSKENVSRA